MKNCITCREAIPDEADFCPYCGTKQEEAEEFPAFCPYCGMKTDGTMLFCPNCGKSLSSRTVGAATGTGRRTEAEGNSETGARISTGASAETGTWTNAGAGTGTGANIGTGSNAGSGSGTETAPPISASSYMASSPSSEKKESRGFLMLFGVLFAVLYLYEGLQYFPLLSYYRTTYKLLGVFLIAVYLWDALLLFLIAVYSRRDNGRHLLYGLFLGTVISVILRWYASGTLGYMWNTDGGILSIFMLILVAAGCWFLMNKHNLLQTKEEYGSAWDVIKGIPGVIHDILFSGKAGDRKIMDLGLDGAPKEFNRAQKILWAVGGSIWALVLCIAYTGNLLNQIFFHFSITGLIGYVFSIFICIGLWLVYSGCKNKRLNASGFSMINVILTIEMVLWLLVAVIIVFAGFVVFAAGEIAGGLLIFVIAFLLGFYWLSLRKVSHCACGVVNGTEENLHPSLGPIILLVLTAVWRIMLFVSKISMQFAANRASNGILQYSNEVSSELADYLEEYGLAYQYGYGGASSLMQNFTEPAIDWIQSNFGLQESVIGMLLTLLIPLSAAVVLAGLRERKTGNPETQDEQQKRKIVMKQ